MRKLVLSGIFLGLYSISVNAQPLFTYGNKSVTKEEFLRVYKKNTVNKEADMSDTALRSYLNLYSLFRMKVAEAEKEHLDTLSNIQKELDNYRKTLSKNYLTDDQVIGKLVKEAYERMQWDVHVEHILVNCPPGNDTTGPAKKIDSIYNELNSGKVDFETMAKAVSDDKGSKDNGGDVGSFSGMQTIYSFENAAFNTPVGKISKPFKTQFGYHVLKVLDKQADPGQVKVAQIMIAVPKSKGEAAVEAGKKRADSVMTMLKSGSSFEELVKTYSDDQFTNKEGGVMKPFGIGKMTPAFEKAAFGLKKPGELAGPIKTDYGFHIIKLVNKIHIEPFDSIAGQLKRKVENDSRAQSAKEKFFEKIKEKNNFKAFAENIKEVEDKLMAIPDTGKNGKIVKASEYSNMVKPVFTMAGKTYLQSDFVKFVENLTHGRLNGPRLPVVKDAYNLYVTSVVTDFEEHRLVEENPEFKNLMEEYRDGIMLFELMDRNVWGKASHDSEGLKAFFEMRKGKYMWEPGFEGAIYKFKNKAMYDTGMTMLTDKTVTEEQIVKRLNTQSNPDGVSIQRGRYEFSHFKDATQSELEANSIKVISPATNNGVYTVIVVKKIYKTAGEKSLDEARGYVVAEYQDYLEKKWNDKMRADYPCKVNEAVFATLGKEKGNAAPKGNKSKTSKKK
jgi:peptidyl-prolyl cis-trans isomerase SurA